jgi:hypothetical protein
MVGTTRRITVLSQPLTKTQDPMHKENNGKKRARVWLKRCCACLASVRPQVQASVLQNKNIKHILNIY